MGAKTHKSLVQYFLHDVLSHYSCILLSNGYMTGFIGLCFAFTLVRDYTYFMCDCYSRGMQVAI